MTNSASTGNAGAQGSTHAPEYPSAVNPLIPIVEDHEDTRFFACQVAV